MAFVLRAADYLLDCGTALWNKASVDEARAYRRDDFWTPKATTPQTVALSEAIVGAISFANTDAATIQNKVITIDLSYPARETNGRFRFMLAKNDVARNKFKEAFEATEYRFTNEYEVAVTTSTLDKREDNAQSRILKKTDTFVITNGGLLRATTLVPTERQLPSQTYSTATLRSNHFSEEVIQASIPAVVPDHELAQDDLDAEDYHEKITFSSREVLGFMLRNSIDRIESYLRDPSVNQKIGIAVAGLAVVAQEVVTNMAKQAFIAEHGTHYT